MTMTLEGTPLATRCGECRGYGVRTHPAWADWWEEVVREQDRSHLTQTAAIDRVGSWLPQPGVPEEIACGACEGRGEIPTPEGERLLAFVRRHLGAA